jgi:OmpA-OmpF porin, OOP family
MLKKASSTIICIMLLFILSNVASAQVTPSTFSLTPYIGGYSFDNDKSLDGTAVYGIGLGYDFTKYLGLEASGEYLSTDVDLAVHPTSSKVYNYRMDGVFNLIPDSRVVPFVFAGFGGQSIDYPRGISNRTESAVDYGAGLKLFFTDKIALRAAFRQVYISHNSLKDNEYILGLTFSFGGHKHRPVSLHETTSERTPEPMPKLADTVIILESEPKAEEKVAAVATEPKIIVLAFEDVHFDFNKSTLTPEAQTILKRNIQLLRDNPKAQIRVAGYTSASGTEEYNQKLSERRANAVQEYLVNEGIITRDRLSSIGYGKTNPAMYEAAPKELYSTAAKANMRVLFEIVVK